MTTLEAPAACITVGARQPYWQARCVRSHRQSMEAGMRVRSHQLGPVMCELQSMIDGIRHCLSDVDAAFKGATSPDGMPSLMSLLQLVSRRVTTRKQEPCRAF